VNSDNERDVPDRSMIPWISSDLVKAKKSKPYFQTNDIVIIALFCSLGGIFSTFIGYFANLINSIIGIPFGGGQILAGLHIFWLVFIFLLVDRKVGVVLLAGILKGFIEFFTGNAHGLLVILLSSSQGLILELFFILFLGSRRKSVIIIAAGVAGVSNIVLQQILFFNSQIPIPFLLLIGIMSFISGLIFGGFLPLSIYHVFRQASILQWRKPSKMSPQFARNLKYIRVSFIALLLISQVVMISYLMLQNQHSIQVTGDVYNPYTYYPNDFPHITIEAELVGDVTYIPPMNYSGVPLSVIVGWAQPERESYNILIKASDGYAVIFTNNNVSHNSNIIIISNLNSFALVAAGFHGSLWIKNIVSINIENSI
jgi:ABC-type thiamin/hydroxymethylpyrimidine transport system permease subunit